jgi:hypothetical protein
MRVNNQDIKEWRRADHMKYDNLPLVEMDNTGDLDALTSEEGEAIFTVRDGVLCYENPLNSPPRDGSSQYPSGQKAAPAPPTKNIYTL